jgi:hypothetical protein
MSEREKGSVEVRDGRMHIDIPAAITDDALVLASQRAMQRIEAVKQIKVMALAVTNASDWTDQGGKPYMQASGAEKVANLFAVSWTLDEPTIEYEEDGNYTYIYRGNFRMPGREISADGARSSKDPFFTKYDWIDKIVDGKPVIINGQKQRTKIAKPISEIDKRDVRIAAMTNCLGNGITRILGIRNLTWEDLLRYAEIRQADVSRIDYKSGKAEEKKVTREPQEKAGAAKGGPQTAQAAAKNGPAAATAATATPPDPNRKAEVGQVTTLKILLKKAGIDEAAWPTYCADWIGNGVELKDIADMSSKHAGGIILALQGEQGGQGELIK